MMRRAFADAVAPEIRSGSFSSDKEYKMEGDLLRGM